MDPHTVTYCTDTYFSLWVVGQNGDGFGMPRHYDYTNSGRMLDKKEGKDLCEELDLTWKYPKLQKVIPLAPGCQHILQDMKAFKVISLGVPGDIILTEAIFAHNSRIRQDMRLSPFQLVTGKQSDPPPIDDTGEGIHSSINRLKPLGVKVPDKQGGDPQDVTIQYQHTVACSVGLNDSPGSPNQEEILGAELVNKGDPQKFANSAYSKSCKCGQKRSKDQSFPHNFSKEEKSKKPRDENYVLKKGLTNHPPHRKRLVMEIIIF